MQWAAGFGQGGGRKVGAWFVAGFFFEIRCVRVLVLMGFWVQESQVCVHSALGDYGFMRISMNFGVS